MKRTVVVPLKSSIKAARSIRSGKTKSNFVWVMLKTRTKYVCLFRIWYSLLDISYSFPPKNIV